MKNKSYFSGVLTNIRNAVKNILFAFKYLFKQSPFLTIFSLIVFTLVGLFPLAIAYIYKIIVEIVSGNVFENIGVGRLIFLLTVYIFVTIAGKISLQLKEYVNLKLGLKMYHSFSLLYLNKLKEIDLNFFDNPSFFDIVSKSRANVNQHPEQLLFKVISIFENMVSLIGYIFIIIKSSPIFLVFCAASLLVTSLKYKENKTKQFAWKQGVTLSARQSAYYDSIQRTNEFIPEMRLYSLSGFFEEKYQENRKALLKDELKLDFQERVVSIVNNLIRESVTLGVQLYLAYMVVTSRISLGDYTLLVASVEGLIRDGRYFVSAAIDTYILSKDVSFLRDFLSVKSLILSDGENKVKIKRNGGKHSFEFRHVSFRYDGAEKDALTDVSFVIPPGETIALVGGNGSGKSTIMKLLLRLYDPTKGDIYLDGINLKEYDALDYYSTVGAMFQNNINYSASVEETVWFGNTLTPIEAVGDNIDSALRFADIYHTVDKLKNGKKSETTNKFVEDSFEPSGGELQKLALARAFFRESEFIVLDEPSSSFDALSEKKIFERIFKLKDNITTLMITHRLTNIYLSSRIIVLENGRIIESGTHSELCASKGRYFEMYSKQSQHYL